MVSMVLMSFCPKQTDADEAMHADAIRGCEMGRSFLAHSCNHTHCEHPVYLARPRMLGCGASAHY